jgi:hypothetical protein
MMEVEREQEVHSGHSHGGHSINSRASSRVDRGAIEQLRYRAERLREVAEDEARANRVARMRMHGNRVHYGDEVQLQHVKSGQCFLTITLQQAVDHVTTPILCV